jgi:hypothetical protein
MTLRRWSNQLPNDLECLGFVVHEDDCKHVGVLYHLDDGIAWLCHLGWNWSLRVERPGAQYFWGKSGLDRVEKRYLAAYFDLVGKANPTNIYYGIDSSGRCFDDNGDAIPLPLGKGMTCASFIVNVFKSLQIPLIDESTWPRGRVQDRDWAQYVVDQLENDPAVPRDHVEAIKLDIALACRFRPSEVAGAMLSEDPPVSLADAERLAQEIMNEMTQCLQNEAAA